MRRIRGAQSRRTTRQLSLVVETPTLAKRRQRGVMPASQPLTVPHPKITIVGSGLAGPLMACYLGRAGFAVDLYEKRPDPRTHGPEGGRSINLALSVRGIH